MRSFVAFAICCTLLALGRQAAGFNAQVTTFDNIPDATFSVVSMAPFTRIGDGYYYVEAANKLNWFAAQHHCRRMGAQLASIESDEEMRAISDYLKSLGHSGWFWLSGTDLAHESQFTWQGTGQLITYSKWSPGQPDNAGGNENCVHLWLHAGTYHMNDWQCSQSAYYICEASKPKVVAVTMW